MAHHAATLHAKERAGSYGYDTAELADVLGDLGTAARRFAPGRRPEAGVPVCIGMQPARPGSPDHKDVLLGITRNGRPAISVVARGRNGRAGALVTVWDPSTEDNAGFWRSDLLVPTKAGARILPPTIWFAGTT